MRIFFDEARGEADLLHERVNSFRQFTRRHFPMRLKSLGQQVIDSHSRIERGVGVLENHLEIRARLAEFGALQLLQMPARQNDRPFGRSD